jgi:flagellar biosynthesis chaperone FliJ
MAASKSLHRLLGIRQAEEEHSQTEMEMAMAELRRLMLAEETAYERGKRARGLVTSSAQSGELIDRIAGLQEMTTASRLQRMLAQLINMAKENVDQRRQDLLARRVARRQVETMVDAKLAEAKTEAGRKTQLALDDWHRSQRKAETRKTNTASIESDIPLTK